LEQDVWSDEEGYETDSTDPTTVSDSAWLLADNDHSPEYYRQLAEDFYETENAQEDYKSWDNRPAGPHRRTVVPVSVHLSTYSAEPTACRFCKYIEKDPKEMYRTVHTGLLYSFFD
jgi:hypothetical protein